jgi:hypothetical protein
MNRVITFVFWSETNAKTVPFVFLGMLIFCLGVRRLLLHKSEKIRNIPFMLIALTIVFLELWKQSIFQGASINFYAIPLWYSSIFLYIYPVANFTWGKFGRMMKGIAGTTSIIAGSFLLFNPQDVIGDHILGFFDSFGDFHNVFYHFALLLYAMLFILLEMHVPEPKKDLKRLYITLGIYTIIAGIAANVLQTNYNSFYTSGFPPIEALRQQCVALWGFVPTQIVYDFLVFMSMIFWGSMVYILYFLLSKLLTRLRLKREKKTMTSAELI